MIRRHGSKLDAKKMPRMGTVEFNSACYYRYAVVDWEKLVANLQSDADLAARGLRVFLQGFVLAEPTGKQNSFLGIWEQLNNPAFKPIEFDGFRKQAGLNSFTLTPKQWIEQTHAIGLISKAGRYGGTFAQKDIAFEFASWISVEFKLYLIKEFQRLKAQEFQQLGWDIRRNLAKVNYLIHTDAIKENLIPDALTAQQIGNVYANEADLLNMALFGVTAKQWRDGNPELKGNIRDHANVHQLVCLANLEAMNAHFISLGIPQAERLRSLNALAIRQMRVLMEKSLPKLLQEGRGD